MKRFVVVLTVWAMGLAWVLTSVVLPAGSATAAASPGPVTSVSATPASTSIALSWTNPADASLTGVMIRRAPGATPPATATDGTLVTDTVKAATSFTDKTALTSGTQYSYALFAHDAIPVYATAATVTST